MRERAGGALALASVGTLVVVLALAGCNSSSATVKVPVPTAAPGAVLITLDRKKYKPSLPFGVTV